MKLMALVNMFSFKEFPLKALIIIVIGIAGILFTVSITPYLEEGTEIINQIPDVELSALSGDEMVYSTIDPLGRPEYCYVKIRDINQSALIYVYWEVEAGWIIPLPGETLMGVEGYIFDESNFELFKQGKDAHHISYGQLAIMGQMYGIAPEDGDYYIVFDNSQDTMRNMPFKTINYNVRSYVPAHEERIEKEGPVWIARSLYILFVGIILVGLLNIVWMKFKNRRDGSSIPPQDG